MLDPIANYGYKAANYLMDTIQNVPVSERKIALKALLDALDPSLWDTAAKKAAEFEKKGMPAEYALRRGLAASMANGIAKEIVDAGLKRGVSPKSQLSLGTIEGAIGYAQQRAFEGLGLTWSDINPLTYVKKGARHIKGTVESFTSGVSKTGSKIASASKSAVNWVGSSLKTLGGLACDVANNPATAIAAGAAAAGLGSQPGVGVAGATLLSAVCGGQSLPEPAPAPTPTTSGSPSWLLPAAVGGGALVLVLALKK